MEWIRDNLGIIFRWIGAGAGAVITYVFGGADSWLIAMLVLVIIDYISGVIAAAIRRELSSKKGFDGILKKVLLFCVVAVAHIIDQATSAGGVLRNLVIGSLIANEGISILENCAKAGVPFPEKLLTVLEQLKGIEEKH